eukprot:275944-Amphidinium_carterae.1
MPALGHQVEKHSMRPIGLYTQNLASQGVSLKQQVGAKKSFGVEARSLQVWTPLLLAAASLTSSVS